MKNKTGLVPFLEQVFWIFLFVNPFLDIFNGVYINVIMGVGVVDAKEIGTLGVTPSLLVRMGMLVVFALYLLLERDWKSALTLAPMGAAFVLSIASEYLACGHAGVFMDLQYSARFCYNVISCMVYCRVFSARWRAWGRGELVRRLDTVAAFTLLVLSLSILVTAVSGAGYSTYADRMGFRGSRGFFYSGNDIISVLTLLLPVVMVRFMAMDRKTLTMGGKLFFALAGGAGTNALVVLGTKTAFLAVGASYALLLCAALCGLLWRREGRTLRGFLALTAASAGIFALLMLLTRAALWDSIVTSASVTQKYAENEGLETALLSGRTEKLADYWQHYRAGGPLVWAFGFGRASMEKILEMDVFEVLFYYGAFGLVAMLWFYGKLAVEFISSLLRCRPFNLTGLVLLVTLLTGAGYLFLAGHVLFSVTSGFYFVFVIAYSRVWLAKGAEDVLLWRAKPRQ